MNRSSKKILWAQHLWVSRWCDLAWVISHNSTGSRTNEPMGYSFLAAQSIDNNEKKNYGDWGHIRALSKWCSEPISPNKFTSTTWPPLRNRNISTEGEAICLWISHSRNLFKPHLRSPFDLLWLERRYYRIGHNFEKRTLPVKQKAPYWKLQGDDWNSLNLVNF